MKLQIYKYKMMNSLKSLLENRNGGWRITDQNFSDENVSGSVVIETVFNKCRFEKVNLQCTSFSKSTFQECVFFESNLSDAKIYKCNFDNCIFMKSKLYEAEILDTTFHLSQFEEVSFGEACLDNCNFQDTYFRNISKKDVPASIENSKISVLDCSINLNGEFNFHKLLEFVNSIYN